MFEIPAIAQIAEAVDQGLLPREEVSVPDLALLEREGYRAERPFNRH